MKKEEYRIASTNKTSRLMITVWKPDTEIRAILQISHGMIDHIGRYEELARYLTKRGILVVGNDHIGHGRTALSAADYGYFEAAKGCTSAETVLMDLYKVMKSVKKDYPDVPYFLLGHSMGSFFARAFTLRWGKELSGALFIGTGDFPFWFLGSFKLILRFMSFLFGNHHRSKLLAHILRAFNNQRCHPRNTNSDWLSKDRKRVWEYINDPYCQFEFTLNGYETLIDILTMISNEERRRFCKLQPCEEYLKTLPLTFLSGKEDPIGGYGASVKAVYCKYKKMGCKNVFMKLYPTDRHELFNETDRKEFFRQFAECLERNLRMNH